MTGKSDDGEELKLELLKLLQEAERLINASDELVNRKIAGADQLKRKIQSEQQFLIKIQKSGHLKRSHVECSNLRHLSTLVALTGQYSEITGIFRPQFYDQNTQSLRVDILCDLGLTWVKAIAKSPVALHKIWMGQGCTGERSITNQAEQYLHAAAANGNPRIVFHFVCGLTEPVAKALEVMGVEVKGERLPVPKEFQMCNDDEVSSIASDGSSEQTFDNEVYCLTGHDEEASNDAQMNASIIRLMETANRPINLDTTALFCLCSNLTNGFALFCFKEPLLNEQAQRERLFPAKPFVQKTILNRDLICCETASTSFRDIVSVVGGNEEKRRAAELLPKIRVVPDCLSPRAMQLRLGGKIKERSLKIFGSGDYYGAVTLTANKGFVQAAINQGVRFAVVIHESRALSEQKQNHATLCQSNTVMIST